MEDPLRRLRTTAPLLGVLLALASPLAAQSAPADAGSWLWRVDGLVPSYVFGTIHLADARVASIPPGVEAVLQECQALLTEVPEDEATRQSIREQAQLPAGESLAAKLPDDLRQRLVAYLKRRGCEWHEVEGLRPWAAAARIVALGTEAAPLQPLDQRVYDLATASRKSVSAIESAKEHLSGFEMLDEAEQVAWLAGTLAHLEEHEAKGKSYSEEWVTLYLAGDADGMQRAMLELLPGDSAVRAKVAQQMVYRRNVRMANRIADKVRAARTQSHLFAIGAGHLGGPRGVLALLEAQGFAVRRISPAPATATTAGAVPGAATSSVDEHLRRLETELKRLAERVEALEKKVGQGGRQ